MTSRQAIWTAIWSIILFSGAAYLYMNREHYKWPPVKPTVAPITATITPPFDIGFEAVTIINSQCLDWSNQVLTEIEPNEQVSVLGRNRDASWYMVRWAPLATACWSKADMMKPSNFSPEELFVISAPFPPIFTGTPTFMTVLVSGTTDFPTPTIPTQPTQTKKPSNHKDDTPTSRVDTPRSLTDTPKPPTDTSKPPTDTPKPPTDTPKPPTPTANPPTNTPSGPRQCSDGIDNDGDNKIDYPVDSGCRNRGDDSE